jgi:hypothetical protein
MLKVKTKIMHAFCLLAFYICNLMIFWTGWGIISKVLILFFSGYIVLALKYFIKQDREFLKNLDIVRGSWVVVYMIGMGVLSYLSSFDGSNLIPFGYDFILVGLLTGCIYLLAAGLYSYTVIPALSQSYIDYNVQ